MPGICQVWPVPTPGKLLISYIFFLVTHNNIKSLDTHIYGKIFCTIEPKTPRPCIDDSDCLPGKYCKPSKRPYGKGTCVQIRLPNKPKGCMDDSDCSPEEICFKDLVPFGKGLCKPRRVKPGKLWNL